MAAQNHRRNAFWGLVSALVDIFCGLYTSRLLLNAFGATAHGLINAVNNFLGLVLAIELAFLCSSKKRYYRFLDADDKNSLSAFYHSNKRTNRRISCLAVISIIAVALIYPLFYLNQFTYWDTAILVFALGLYILIRASTRAETSLLTADYKSYIIKILNIFTAILTTLICFCSIQSGCNLPTVKMLVALVLLMHPLFYLIYIRKHYQMPKPASNLPPYTTNPIIIVERISNAFLGRLDVLILAIAATLTDVSIYAVYYMAGRYLCQCINALFTGREAVYGHAFAQNDERTALRAYAKTHFYLANLLGVAFGIGVVMLNSFVSLYTKWIPNVDYTRFWFGFALLMAQMLSCIVAAQKQVIYAAKSVRRGQILFDTIMEAVINLVVSVALVPFLGITGVAVGTVVALTYRIIRSVFYRRKYVFKGSVWQPIRRYIPTAIMIVIALITARYYAPHPNDKFEWAFESIKIGLIFVVFDLILNLTINFRNCKPVLVRTYYCLKRGIKKIRRFCIFVGKALGGIYQRGLFRAVRTYFAHKKVQAFTAAHPDMADLPYLTTVGKLYLGKDMDLTHPQTLNEKINWLKINYQNDLITLMSDKVAAKDYAAKKLGAQYVIPTYGVWDSFDAIDWDTLPHSFVLKCTHDSGSIYVVKDKDQLDKNHAKRHFEHFLNFAYWRKFREWGYKHVKPQIIAEEYLPSIGGRHSTEYKFTCFNGKVVFGTVCSGFPHGFHKRRVNDFYDRDFNHLSWRAWYRNAHRHPKKPEQWEEMIALSEKFAQNLPYLRVDLYLVDDKIYFGEFTFYTGGGFIEFHPCKMDLVLGQMLTLPEPCYDTHATPITDTVAAAPKAVDKQPVNTLKLPADEPTDDLAEDDDE